MTATLHSTLPLPAPGHAIPHPPAVPRRVVAAAVAGNALEYYDFIAYAFFAVYIGKAFFPTSTPYGSLLLSVAVFGVGFFTRPLGAVLIGLYADRVGRRPAMMLTIGLITTGTVGLALTPSYASIGMAAPVIVVLARLAQGLALGGEMGPSTAFLLEAAPPGRRGLYASWQMASQGIAMLMAGTVGTGLAFCLTTAQLQDWGWRLPFAAGLLLLPVALYLRRTMPETLGAATGADAGHRAGPVGLSVLRPHRRIVLLAILAVSGGAVAFYVGSYLTTYALATLGLPPRVALAATLTMGATTVAFALWGGWLCDRYGRKPTMLWSRIACGLLGVPAFLLLAAQPSLATLLLASAVLAACNGVASGACMIAIPEMLPRGVRATGFSIAYAGAVCIFGGTTQVIATWLIEATGDPAAPAWYLAGISALAALAVRALPETRDRPLQD